MCKVLNLAAYDGPHHNSRIISINPILLRQLIQMVINLWNVINLEHFDFVFVYASMCVCVFVIVCDAHMYVCVACDYNKSLASFLGLTVGRYLCQHQIIYNNIIT